MNDYSKYSPEIQEYIKKAESSIIEKYGKLDESWTLNFKMLADDLWLYEECRKSIEEKGVYNDQKSLKHPLVCTLKDLQTSILKIVQQLGFSPWSSSKIKNTDEDDSDDFLDRLRS